MRKMKDSGIEWIGEIPDTWELTQTRRLYKSVKRVVGDRVDDYDRLALTMRGVIKRSKEDSEGLQPEKFEGYQILEKNELVFKMIDLENVNTSRVGLSPYTGLVSPAYIVLSNELNDNRYSYYWFMFMYYQEIFNHIGGDGVRSALSAKDMLSLPIPNVSEEEKIKIADYLDHKCQQIDSYIFKQEQIIEKLNEYKLSIITESVTHGLDPCAKMKNNDIPFLDEIPSHWQCAQIKHLHAGLTDGTHGTYERFDKGHLLLSSKNVREETLEIGDDESYISDEDYKSIVANGFPKRNDVLLCCIGASIGRCVLFDRDEPEAFQRSVIMIRSGEKILPEFLLYSLKSKTSLNQEQVLVNQSAQPGLYQGLVSRIYIPVPGIEEQKNISLYLNNKVKKINTVIEKKSAIVDQLREYKKTLIYEVVTGKKEIA